MRTTIATALALSLVVPVAACHRNQAPSTPTPPEWLEGAVEEQAHQSAPNAVRVGDLYKATAYSEGDHQDWQVTLEGGGCIHLSAVGDQTVEEIAIYLWDPSGKRLDKVDDGAPRAVLHYCPPSGAQGAYKFEAKVQEGHGHFAVGLFADEGAVQPGEIADNGDAPGKAGKTEGKDGKTEGKDGKVDPKAKPAANLDGEVDALAKTSAPGATKMGESFNGNASSTDWYVALEPGKCYWFVGAGDNGVGKLALYLWDPADQRVKANSAETNRVTVGHCPDKPGMYHFRAQVTGGEGAYKVGVYAKKK